MAVVTEEMMRNAYDLEQYRNWRIRLRNMTPVDYAYKDGESRRYYRDEDGKYCYRRVTESEMHRNK